MGPNVWSEREEIALVYWWHKGLTCRAISEQFLKVFKKNYSYAAIASKAHQLRDICPIRDTRKKKQKLVIFVGPSFSYNSLSGAKQ